MPSPPIRFQVGDDGDYDGKIHEQLISVGEKLREYVTELAMRCPKLERVDIAGPEGYQLADYFFKFRVGRRVLNRLDDDDGQEQVRRGWDDVLVDMDIRLLAVSE